MDAISSWKPSSDHLPGRKVRQLDRDWRMVVTETGAFDAPGEAFKSNHLLDAPVPGTVAAALEAAGQFDRDNPPSLDEKDVWYFRAIEEGTGRATLRLEGLAGIADVYWNGVLVLQSKSMFLAHDVEVALSGKDELAFCFKAMGPELKKKIPRARWRPQMITPANIRGHRQTLLGRMPGWCPEVHAVGPWRPVSLVLDDAIGDVKIVPTLGEDGVGHLQVSISGEVDNAAVLCAGVKAPLRNGTAVLAIPGVAPWWPHTHGQPVLHDIELEIEGRCYLIGRTGFRRAEVDHGAGGQGFALKINGTSVFCRGAVWTNADIVSLPGGVEDYRPWLERAAEAGMNMIRVSGTMVYEAEAFYRLCDELGLMVWQEAMLANFDYPVKDEEWVSLLGQEIEQFLERTAASPSITVFCGGSEMHQQAAMLGLPKETYEGPLTQEIIPQIVSRIRPDCVYVPNSPHGGAMPFSPNAGVTHYYGVGAYCRPLDDARRANVRFAAECLAFANVPEQATLDTHLPVPPVHDPRWKARVPRDRGAGWDFDDVRDHYLKLLYDVEPAKLRHEDMARYLDLSRAVTGEVVEATYAEWRKPGSSCAGALMWTYQDLMAGPGWGLVDATGLPKPVWHAARRAFRPLQITLTDEGTNGLDVNLINELSHDVAVIAEITCLKDGKVPVVSGRKDMMLGSRSGVTLPATDFFGAFFDTTYAFRFGPPSHDVVVARLLLAETGEDIASAFHFPLGRAAARHACELRAELSDADGWTLRVATDRLAQNVIIEAPGFLASDNWFHLAPGQERVIRLSPLDNAIDKKPTGTLRLPGGQPSAQF
ncbi:glycoside hydrolase family 2 protein [Rhizobium sp. L1K21]|uniref:glycoside hydrolase family 2 protein n=1 Tax=Rhizobium sp. L1K21 TaxID=2954933 RepID=UPI002093CB53|nr:glycoside hydrolase family 2 protein [Rhizobium sp. L1K21]MCO6185299.1 glycoside hydrolase family 2 protein [Rhizobium sp. L1K21]